MSKPRVALVYDRLYPLYRGGAERRFFELGRRLGHRFEFGYFFYSHGQSDAVAGPGVHFPIRGARPMYVKGRRSVSQSAEYARGLVTPLRSFRPEVIDCSSVSYGAVLVSAAIARSLQRKLVITWHEFMGAAWHEYLGRPLSYAAVMIERVCPALAATNVAVSQFTARRLEEATRSRPVLIPNGIDLVAVAASQPATASLDAVFVGRLIAEKQPALFVRSLGRASAAVRSLTAMIIGEGPELQAVEREADLLPNNVHLTIIPSIDNDHDLYGLMKSAKVLVLPSLREGYGLVVAEAQACGAVPVIIRSPMNAAVELVEDGVTGCVCENSETSIAAALVTLVSDHAYRHELRRKAQSSSQQHDWNHSAEMTAVVYDELAR